MKCSGLRSFESYLLARSVWLVHLLRNAGALFQALLKGKQVPTWWALPGRGHAMPSCCSPKGS